MANRKEAGMEHLSENICRPNEFLVRCKRRISVEPHGNTVDYKRHEDLQGKRILRFGYLVRDKS